MIVLHPQKQVETAGSGPRLLCPLFSALRALSTRTWTVGSASRLYASQTHLAFRATFLSCICWCIILLGRDWVFASTTVVLNHTVMPMMCLHIYVGIWYPDFTTPQCNPTKADMTTMTVVVGVSSDTTSHQLSKYGLYYLYPMKSRVWLCTTYP